MLHNLSKKKIYYEASQAMNLYFGLKYVAHHSTLSVKSQKFITEVFNNPKYLEVAVRWSLISI